MGVNFKECKEAARAVADYYKISYDSAVEIIKVYSVAGDGDGVRACLALDADKIGSAAALVGVCLHPGEKEKPAAGCTTKTRKKADKKPGKADNIKIHDDIEKSPAQGVNTPEGIPAGVIPLEVVESIIQGYCEKYKIESPEKLSGLQFRSACMLVGQYIKENKLIENIERSRREGGRVLDGEKVSRLIDLFVFVAGSCRKVPLMSDFAAFAGVSLSWLYDNNGACQLTSAGANILKKLHDMQAAGVGSGIVNDQTAQVGRIFFAKSQLGWSDAPGAVIQKEEKAAAADGLPVFDGDKLLKLPKNQ